MSTRWGKPEDAKLKAIWSTVSNRISTKDLSVPTLKAVHSKFFPERDYRRFAIQYRKKAREVEGAKSLDGAQKRK